MPLLYLVGSRVTPEMLEAFRTGRNPRPEYYSFLERNDAVLLSNVELDTSTNRLAQFFLARKQHGFGLASMALGIRPSPSAILTSGEDVGLPLALLARFRFRNTPIHIITHGSYFGSRKFPRLIALLRGMGNLRFLCLSEALRQRMIREFGVSPRQALNGSYYVDSQYFAPSGTPSSPPVIASVGAANRDYRTLVKAAEPLGVRLRIAADSAWFKIKVDVQDDRLPENVELGSFDYAGLRLLYAAAPFVVVPLYPGKHASGYTAIVEAMSMERPVIATWTEANSDFLVDGENGFYVQPGDVEGLREKMRRLLDHPDEARAMGKRARERVEQFFSVEAYCARLECAIRGESPPDIPLQ